MVIERKASDEFLLICQIKNISQHSFMKNIKSNRTDFLLKGFTQFHVENEIINLTEGEIIVIPKNKKFAKSMFLCYYGYVKETCIK